MTHLIPFDGDTDRALVRATAVVPSDAVRDLWEAIDEREPFFPRRMVMHSLEPPKGRVLGALKTVDGWCWEVE